MQTILHTVLLLLTGTTFAMNQDSAIKPQKYRLSPLKIQAAFALAENTYAEEKFKELPLDQQKKAYNRASLNQFLTQDFQQFVVALHKIMKYTDQKKSQEVLDSALFFITERTNLSLEYSEMLVELGANPNFEDKHYSTFAKAIINNKFALAELLLDRGANPNTSIQSLGALTYVASNPRAYEFAKKLIEKGAFINLPYGCAPQPLSQAILGDNQALAILLANKGGIIPGGLINEQYVQKISKKLPSQPSVTAAIFHNKILNMQLSSYSLLISQAFSCFNQDDLPMVINSLIQMAHQTGEIDSSIIFAAARRKIDLTPFMQTIFKAADNKDRPKTIKLIFDAYAKKYPHKSLSPEEIYNLLKNAIFSDNAEIIDIILPYCKNISEIKNQDETTPLMLAVKETPEIAEKILNSVPDTELYTFIHARDKDGKSALYHAMGNSNPSSASKITKLLLEKGISVENHDIMQAQINCLSEVNDLLQNHLYMQREKAFLKR